jgi:hypothetical protein
MDVKEIIISQYLASLEMLKKAVTDCPDSLWDDSKSGNKFWHIAYHALFYAQLYLADSENAFVPWSRHRMHYEHLGPLPSPPHTKPEIGEPYTREDVLEYLAVCQAEVVAGIGAVRLDAESGFPWLPFSKLEVQFYNIRHIQHHVGTLYDRLGSVGGTNQVWVRMKP